MEKKNLLFVAAAMVMAGCASDDMIGDNNATQSDNQVIGFNMSTPAMTRTETTKSPEQSATDLGNEFIVWGEKNENGAADLNSGNIVFENYRVQYTANSANTTSSNTKNWEYVGITPYHADGTAPTSGNGDETTASVSPSMYTTTTPTQTIKYWDFGKPYTFTAVSALKTDITSGKVKITKNYGKSSAAEKGYTIELGTGANPGKIYVADRQTITKSAASTSGAAADAVQLKFRNFQTKIRFGIYETVPGYKVVITGIKYNGSATTDNKFGIEGNFIQAGDNTKYKVTYVASGDNLNKAQVDIVTTDDNNNSITPNAETYLKTEGTTWLTTANGIGTASSTPTWDNAGTSTGEYTAIQPNTSNSTNLKLQIAYKLISEDTGEEIKFMNGNEEIYRTVEVPAAYCQWKSNYAYTYLFKITDKSAELYPITFDAVVVESETGTQETITEVSEPSITTMGVGSDKKVITGQNEYTAGSTIYASVVDADATSKLGGAAALTANGNINLYTVTTTNDDKTTITEAAVANCLAQTKYNTSLTTTATSPYKNGELTVTNENITANENIVAAVPTEEGTDATRDLNALKWTTSNQASADVYYVVEYIKTSGQTKTYYYKVVKVVK